MAGGERRRGDPPWDGTSQPLACCGDVPVCGNDAINLKPCLSLGRAFFCKISRVGAAAMHETDLITRIEGVTHHNTRFISMALSSFWSDVGAGDKKNSCLSQNLVD